jgi:cellulose synthase operon protein C
VKRFPLLPQLWLDRASAARARRDDQEEETSLRTALQINPTWSSAVLRLADLHERQDRSPEAAHLLRHASARNPLDPTFHQVLAETLWRLDQKEEAVERAQQAIRLEPGYDRAWEHLHYWASELEEDPALNMGRELTHERAGEARSWQVLASLLDRDDQREERYAAIEKALQLNPRYVDAHDWKARSLAGEMKWEEALAACAAEVWEGHPPSELKARAAWIEAQRGHLPAAIARMEAVVEESPGFFGAWSQLADWYQAIGDKDGNLRAAEALVRINPQYEVSLGYLADARLQNGDTAGAREALQRAFDLDPRYDFAGNMLFDLQFEAGEFEAAAQTNARVRRHADSPDAIARMAQVAAKQGDTKPILEALERLVADPDARPWSLEATVNAALEAECMVPAKRIIDQQLDAETCNRFAAAKWVDLQVAQGKLPPVEQLHTMMSRPERGREAVRAYVDSVVGMPTALDALVRAGRPWLMADTHCWGYVARAYCQQLRYRDCRRWLGDWQARSDLEAWMLVGVVESLRAFRKLEQARECSRLAIAMPYDYAQPIHYMFLAADAALAGQTESARNHLDLAHGNGEREWPLDYQLLIKIAQAVLDLDQAPPAERPRLFGQLRRELHAMRAAYPSYHSEPERRRLYCAALRKLARLRGGWQAILWQGWALAST